MADISHHLRITPNFDGEFPGVTVESNHRTLWFSSDMWQELQTAVTHVASTGTEWRNYEEPQRAPVTPYTPPPLKPKTIDDVLDLL